MNNNNKPAALPEDILEKVAGGASITDVIFEAVTNILKQCGDLAWSLQNWNDLWNDIHEAETATISELGKRADKINHALFILGNYKAALGSRYDEMKSNLEYCYTFTVYLQKGI